MGFSEKMRESLGAEGVRIELVLVAPDAVPGEDVPIRIALQGGTREARVDALTVRVIEADRHWRDTDGVRVEEAEAQALPDRRHLTAAWDRRALGLQRFEIGRELGPGERYEVELAIAIPSESSATSTSTSHTLNVQADIKGQIDPTANARIVLLPRVHA